MSSQIKSFISRKKRVRYKIKCNSNRLRLSIFRSNKHIYAQAIDLNGDIVASSSTLEKDIKKLNKSNCNKQTASQIGRLISERLLQKGIKEVVLDKGGYKYHGVVKSFADAARVNLNF